MQCFNTVIITKITIRIHVCVIILTSETRIVRVAEATFTVTGPQSALSLAASAVSKAELTISMPLWRKYSKTKEKDYNCTQKQL